MIKVTSQMRRFVETRGCLFVAVTVLAVLWVSQAGEEGGSNNFTLIYCSTPYQHNSRKQFCTFSEVNGEVI